MKSRINAIALSLVAVASLAACGGGGGGVEGTSDSGLTSSVIPPISTGPKSRTVMQPWPDAALG